MRNAAEMFSFDLTQIRREQKMPGPLLLVYFMTVNVIADPHHHHTYGGFIKDEYCSWVQYKSGPGGRPSM